MIDTLSEPLEDLSLDQLQFHPKVMEKLYMLIKERADVRTCRPESLAHRQGNVEMLDWFLKLPAQIMEEHRKAKAAGR